MRGLKKIGGIPTCFEQNDLVVLRQFHKPRHHFGELDDLLDDLRQFLRAVQPELLVRQILIKQQL